MDIEDWEDVENARTDPFYMPRTKDGWVQKNLSYPSSYNSLMVLGSLFKSAFKSVSEFMFGTLTDRVLGWRWLFPLRFLQNLGAGCMKVGRRTTAILALACSAIGGVLVIQLGEICMWPRGRITIEQYAPGFSTPAMMVIGLIFGSLLPFLLGLALVMVARLSALLIGLLIIALVLSIPVLTFYFFTHHR